MPPILLLLRQTGCVCANRPLFQQTSLQKIWELYILCLEGGLLSRKQVHRRLAQYLADFFIKLKCANRKTDYHTTQSAREVGGLEVFLCQADHNFEH
jgi:hypothetical protein